MYTSRGTQMVQAVLPSSHFLLPGLALKRRVCFWISFSVRCSLPFFFCPPFSLLPRFLKKLSFLIFLHSSCTEASASSSQSFSFFFFCLSCPPFSLCVCPILLRAVYEREADGGSPGRVGVFDKVRHADPNSRNEGTHASADPAPS